MATFYVSTSGSNTAPYDTWAKAGNVLTTVVNATTADGDIVILDDETHTSPNLSNATHGPGGGATITIKSRSGDKSLCTWTGTDATNGLIIANDALTNWDIQDITLSKNISTPVNNYNLIMRQNADCTVTLTRCSINGINISGDTITNFQGLLIDKSSGTLNIIGGLAISGINASVNRMSTLLNFKDTTTSVADITFDDITLTQTGAYTAVPLMIVSVGTAHNFNHSGDIIATNCSITCTNDDGIVEGFIKAAAASTWHDLSFTNVTAMVTLGRVDGISFYVSGNVTARNITVDGATLNYPLTRTKANQTGRCHGIGTYVENNGTLTASHVKSFNCNGIIGSGFYTNGGGTAVIDVLDCQDCTDDAYATVYLGGWGDVTINCLNLTNNTVLNENRVESVFSGILYPYLHENATRDRVITIGNMTIAGNAVNSGDAAYTLAPLFVRNGNQDVQTLTLNISYSVIESDTGDSGILYDPLNLSGVTATIDSSYVKGGAGALTGIGLTNEITGVVLDNDYVLASGSGGIGAGRKWWTGANPVGANDEPFSDFDTDIGASQSTHGNFHPENL